MLRDRNYLPKGTQLKLLGAKPAFGTTGSFCTAEVAGKKGYFRCDKPQVFHFKAAGHSAEAGHAAEAAHPAESGHAEGAAQPTHSSGGGKLGQYCHDIASCKTFCKANCALDLSKWGKGVSSTCKFPAISGSIAPGSSQLLKLPALKHVKGASDLRLTQEVSAGLQRADEFIAASGEWPKGHTLFVRNCWRADTADSTNECDYILKGWHLKEKFASKAPANKAEQEQKALGDRLIDPPKNLGLMWPGATPHSAGIGCDIVVRDAGGKEVTSCKAPRDDSKAKALSKSLVDVLTSSKVGALRLNYEAWHFEWGAGYTGCRCKGADCNDKHWPVACDGPQHCSNPG